MNNTGIEWAQMSWNPITGCTPISDGCAHCYAKRMANWLRGRGGYPPEDPFRVTFHPDRLDEPMRMKKPRTIFVCSMGDLFHEDVAPGAIGAVWQVMMDAPQHVFLVLTKRPERMADVLGRHSEWLGGKHIWIGVTAENQQRYDERWNIASQVPAAKLFVSIEPMLEAIDITRHEKKPDWVILGGETGPGARPMHPDWARSMRGQCVEAGVPFFFKQWGEWAPTGPHTAKRTAISFAGDRSAPGIIRASFPPGASSSDGWSVMYRVGKKAAGRLLDGREWNEVPR